MALPALFTMSRRAEAWGLAGESYGDGLLTSPQGLGPEGAAGAEGALIVKVIEHGRRARTEHPPAGVAQQLGHEDSASAGAGCALTVDQDAQALAKASATRSCAVSRSPTLINTVNRH
ncbi:MAG: hypothetical protein WB800_05710 [Streptosporangiaceae bacterium]